MRTGRPPKPEGEKRHRNAPTAPWVYLPAEGRKGATPKLPGHIAFTDDTRSWWRTIWHTPMATMWAPSDVHALVELALLRQELLGGKLSVGSEVRQRSDEFGLTVAGRRGLRWIIGMEPPVPGPKKASDELAAKRDRRERLSV